MRNSRRIAAWLIIFSLLSVLAGCEEKQQAEQVKEQQAEAETQKDSGDDEIKEDESQPDAKEQESEKEIEGNLGSQKEEEENGTTDSSDETDAESWSIFVYIPGENADGWDIKEEEIPELSPDALIGRLVGNGVLPDSVVVQNFEETEEDGKYLLKIDLSSNFQENIRSMGTTGEILTMGALVNTFLDSYRAEGIEITVNGNVLTSGHEEYSGYLTHIDY